MNLNSNKESWDELKIKLRRKFPQLKETDLQHDEGMEKSMLRLIQYKLEKSKHDMREIIAEL